ncbi:MULTISPECIES: Gfo/Idh/MocA family protein [Rahnella]|uniref:Gfo/Idh/MocA family protein n=1 Tax=Rahnella sp. (strain Y9602) TaxID=2703885 RepID=A0A0H3FE90_RAHSY|nr:MULTISPECIES: Gfo/Idh/MocA family oxidoreductase [Rahnella]AFE57897.1 oxidoreductase domain-containing protein [Rahnella aquatilis HX2]AYA06580.1 gfo/Idh/MocA family oxidoreductase [Rahnella aquatilis]ADW73317.1 oxidoreductase domain protein [Rahnella aceris]AZP50635.1 Gfo/Idh/MocA family oxidoreductase [Rahnella aquatilis]MBU9841627.1 Gfo/Idh/MocA family oxidoreductase [Rahnella aceris]
MSKLRIGVIGLGGIAQKAYLPVLSHAENWTLVGGFSPNQQKAQAICDSYRMACFSRMDELAGQCDAVFVHSSTASHFEVVGQLLAQGVHVYVDKPLAAELEQAEQLVEQARKTGKTLMVGFNRRFAPLYRQLKDNMQSAASLRMDKHRTDSVGPNDLRFTLLDDYLHVVDTALWLAGGNASLESGLIQINEANQMLYGEHHFLCGETLVTTSMHRRAGTFRESVQAVTEGAVYQLDNMQIWREEQQDILTQLPVPGWQSTLTQRGFVGAIEHFVACVSNQTAPETSGEQAIYAQAMIEKILNS